MSVAIKNSWGGSLHQTFRLLPSASEHLRPFLESEGLTPAEVLRRLPYNPSRSSKQRSIGPDPKRFRDGKQLYETSGFLYVDNESRIRVTEFGRAILRWLDIINEKNAVVLGRHAAYALAACQLRNPTGSGQKYPPEIKVFPFAFIWRAMLKLDNKISSDELNRALFKVTNEQNLEEAIEHIRRFRITGDPDQMGEETIRDSRKDDRIIPWMSMASFGWTLIRDKRAATESGYYQILPNALAVLEQAATILYSHHEFASVDAYVQRISNAAALPKDLR